MEHAQRSAVLDLHHAEYSGPDIIKIPKYPKSTVYNIIKMIKTTRWNAREAHKTRSGKIRNPRFLARLSKFIKAKPGTPQTKLAKRKGVSQRTIQRALNDDLGYKSFCLRVRYLLMDWHKEQRVIRGKASFHLWRQLAAKSGSSPRRSSLL